MFGLIHSGNLASAELELGNLQELQKELVEQKEQYKASQVMIQVISSQAWIQFAKGNNEHALELMKEAADMEDNTEKHPITPGEVLPARELLGDMLMAMQKPVEALEAYKMDLKEHPNRFNGIYGAAIAANQVGDKAEAKIYFENLLKLVESVNSDRTEIKEAKSFMRKI